MIRSRAWSVAAFVVLACAAQGCANNTGRGAIAGTALGSGVGALVGMASGQPEAGALVGAAVGGGLGTAIGADADYREKARADEIELANANAAAANPPITRGPLSIDDLVAMSRPDAEGRRVSDDVLIEYIRSTGSSYDLAPADLQFLSANGVSDRVQKEMLASRNRAPSTLRIASPSTRTVVVHEAAPVVIYERPFMPMYYRPYRQPGFHVHGHFR